MTIKLITAEPITYLCTDNGTYGIELSTNLYDKLVAEKNMKNLSSLDINNNIIQKLSKKFNIDIINIKSITDSVFSNIPRVHNNTIIALNFKLKSNTDDTGEEICLNIINFLRKKGY